MPRYVALLRGINVSGQKLIAMANLRAWVADLGYQDVASYIQSGNLVFTAPGRSKKKIAAAIAEAIRGETSFDVPVTLRSAAEMASVVATNPFVAEAQRTPKLVHVAFLEDEPSRAALAALGRVVAGADRFRADGAHLYLHYPNGSARSKLDNNALERALCMRSTARNWNTVLRLEEMARGA